MAKTPEQLAEEIRKLKEGIARFLHQWEVWGTDHPDRKLEDENVANQEHYLNQAGSLLRTVLKDLKIDTGELTKEQIWEVQQGNSYWEDEGKGKAVAKAARAKFVSIGGLMEGKDNAALG